MRASLVSSSHFQDTSKFEYAINSKIDEITRPVKLESGTWFLGKIIDVKCWSETLADQATSFALILWETETYGNETQS